MHSPVLPSDIGCSTSAHGWNPATRQSPDAPIDEPAAEAESGDTGEPIIVSSATVHRHATDRHRVDPTSFAGRLNRLFDAIRPPGLGPLRDADARRELEMRGHQMSAPYLSQLRSGIRANPHPKTIRQLADLFGVRTEYFTREDPDYAELIDAELRWLDLAHDPDVRRIVTGLLELPPNVRDDILRTIDARVASPTRLKSIAP